MRMQENSVNGKQKTVAPMLTLGLSVAFLKSTRIMPRIAVVTECIPVVPSSKCILCFFYSIAFPCSFSSAYVSTAF